MIELRNGIHHKPHRTYFVRNGLVMCRAIYPHKISEHAVTRAGEVMRPDLVAAHLNAKR